MSFKQKVGMGVVTASLSLWLTCGGVFAYFGHSQASNNEIRANNLKNNKEHSI